jgi:hypothetical protein
LLAEREFKCASLRDKPFALPHKSRILLFETKTALQEGARGKKKVALFLTFENKFFQF